MPFTGSPFQQSYLPFLKTQTDQTCSHLGTSCQGGKTTCNVTYVPVVDGDDSVAKVTPPSQVQNSNTISCSYFHSECPDCCTNWAGACYGFKTCYDTQCDNSTPPNCVETNPHNCC